MTLKNSMNSSAGNHQLSNNSELDNNEKYRLLAAILEKKIVKISAENEKIAAR